MGPECKRFLLSLCFLADALGQPNQWANLPISFEPNQGQFAPGVRFAAQACGHRILLTSGGAILTPATPGNDPLEIRWLGASMDSNLRGQAPLPGRANYFMGPDPGDWRTGVPLFSQVRQDGIYPGIDLLYYGREGRLEYDFLLRPNADPAQIRIGLQGSSAARLDPNGDLLLTTAEGELRWRKPAIYQGDGDARHAIEGRYEMAGPGEVRFQLGEYDRSQELVIDPVLEFATFLGGKDADVPLAIAVGVDGSVYVAGYTSSPDFPAPPGGTKPNPGYVYGFIVKLNAAGSNLDYVTFVGGGPMARGIAVDAAGNAYVTGVVGSDTFPTVNAVQPKRVNQEFRWDAFALKLNPSGSTLLYSTFLGGFGEDTGNAIAVDSAGSAYITGSTFGGFPVANALQPASAGSTDMFVTKLSPTGSFSYSTYVGGPGYDFGTGIAVDPAGNAYVAGMGARGFPTVNPLRPEPGAQNAFVFKLNPSGSALLYSTPVGGTGGQDVASGIAVDANGNAYVTGTTNSADFPLVGGFGYGSGRAAFVSKLNPAGSSLLYSTRLSPDPKELGDSLGTTSGSFGGGIAIDTQGSAYVIGITHTETALLLPAVNSLRPPRAGFDIFLAKLNATGTAFDYTTFFPELFSGGSASSTGIAANMGLSVATDRNGNAYVAGSADRQGSLNITSPAPQSQWAGKTDLYIAKISNQTGVSNPVPTLQSLSPASVKAGGGPFTLTVFGTNFVNGAAVLWNGTPQSTARISSTELRAYVEVRTISQGGLATITVYNPPAGGGTSNGTPFRVEHPVPILESVSRFGRGGRIYTVSVRGSNFAAGAVLWVNGAPRASSGGETFLSATLAPGDVEERASLSFAVMNPGPGGGASNTLRLDLAPSRIDSITPNRVMSTGDFQKFTIRGANFSANSSVYWDGSTVRSDFVSSSELRVTASAGNPGTRYVSIFNPSPPYGASNSTTLTVVGGPEFGVETLKGPYVISLQGYIGTATEKVPFALIGQLTADGAGKIAGGHLDYLDPAGKVESDLVGTYSVGAFGLGDGSVTTSLGELPFQFAISSGDHATIHLNSRVGSNIQLVTSGELDRQDEQNLTPNGDYVFGVQGFTVASYMSAAGRFTASSGGRILNGVEDINDTGQIWENTAFTGAFNSGAGGRGTISLSTSGPLSQLVCYTVSNKKLKLLSTDPKAILLGEAEQQGGGTFSVSSLRGDYGFLAKGLSIQSWDTALARLTADGTGKISAGTGDWNASGTVTENARFTGTYEVAANGRGRLRTSGWPEQIDGAFYLTSAGKAKFVRLSTTSALGGVLEAQRPMVYTPGVLASAFEFSMDGLAEGDPAMSSGVFRSDGSGQLWMNESRNTGGAYSPYISIIQLSVAADGRGRISGTNVATKSVLAISPSRLLLMQLGSTVLGGAADAQQQGAAIIYDGGLVNSADLSTGGVPGGLVSLFGEGLATSTIVADSVPWPVNLGGTEVRFVKGATPTTPETYIRAPLYFVSPGQINFQVPWEARSNETGVRVAVNGVAGNRVSWVPAGAPSSGTEQSAPGIFTMNQSGRGQGAILVSATGEIAAPVGSIPGRSARPAKPGEFVSIYCTGLGEAANHPPTGWGAYTDRLSATAVTPLVNIGGSAAWVTFAGLAPGFVGLYQVNVKVPDDVPAGEAVPVYMLMPLSGGTMGSKVVTMAVRP